MNLLEDQRRHFFIWKRLKFTVDKQIMSLMAYQSNKQRVYNFILVRMQESQACFQLLIDSNDLAPEEKIKQLKKENERLQIKAHFLEMENEFLRKGPKEYNLEAQRQIKKLSHSTIVLSKKVLDLCQKLESVRAELSKCEEQLQSRQEKLVMMEEETVKINTELRKKIKDNNTLYAKNQNHKKTCEHLHSTIASLENSYQEQNRKNMDMIKKYQDHIKDLSVEKVNLQASLSEMRSKMKVAGKHKQIHSEILAKPEDSFIFE